MEVDVFGPAVACARPATRGPTASTRPTLEQVQVLQAPSIPVPRGLLDLELVATAELPQVHRPDHSLEPVLPLSVSDLTL